MKSDELIFRLRHMKPGGSMCEGCGVEHNCSTRGCAIAWAAADFIEAALRDMVVAGKGSDCSVCATPCNGSFPPSGNFAPNCRPGSTCGNWRWRGPKEARCG